MNVMSLICNKTNLGSSVVENVCLKGGGSTDYLPVVGMEAVHGRRQVMDAVPCNL